MNNEFGNLTKKETPLLISLTIILMILVQFLSQDTIESKKSHLIAAFEIEYQILLDNAYLARNIVPIAALYIDNDPNFIMFLEVVMSEGDTSDLLQIQENINKLSVTKVALFLEYFGFNDELAKLNRAYTLSQNYTDNLSFEQEILTESQILNIVHHFNDRMLRYYPLNENQRVGLEKLLQIASNFGLPTDFSITGLTLIDHGQHDIDKPFAWVSGRNINMHSQDGYYYTTIFIHELAHYIFSTLDRFEYQEGEYTLQQILFTEIVKDVRRIDKITDGIYKEFLKALLGIDTNYIVHGYEGILDDDRIYILDVEIPVRQMIGEYDGKSVDIVEEVAAVFVVEVAWNIPINELPPNISKYLTEILSKSAYSTNGIP